MMMLRPEDGGYLIMNRRPGDPAASIVAARAEERLIAAGWHRALDVHTLTVWLGPQSRLRAVQVHRQHILIGDWHRKGEALSSIIGGARSASGIAEGAVTGGWGDYIAVWKTDDDRLAILRTPAGALEAVWWRRDGVVFATHEPPECLDEFLPAEIGIDWNALADIGTSMELLGDRLALKGLSTVAPGGLTTIGRDVETVAVWRPSNFYCPGAGWDDDPRSLARVVDEVVAALTAGHDHLLAEVSGGLDSAIVAASFVATGRQDRAAFMNFYDDRPEGDEGRYAQAVADRLGLTLERVHKPVCAVTAEDFAPLGLGVRPALHGLDAIYDRWTADRAVASGATALLTGQGGDAVFFQAPDPFVVVDRVCRLGPRGLSPAYVSDIARWTRHSAWTIADLALRRRRPKPVPSARAHPWLEGIEHLPPAKAAQVRRFVNAQLFWGDCSRARAATLLHPLLTQPVVEHCLAIPADILTQGPRDRGLARIAFGDRLPSAVIDRRDKGDLSSFYGHVVRGSARNLRELLLNGLLAEHGLLDPEDVDAGLDETRLIRDPAGNRFLIFAVLEVWACRWTERLAVRRGP